jgi:hypothetical protein
MSAILAPHSHADGDLYASLAVEHIHVIRDAETAIRSHQRRAFDEVVAIGRELARVKAILPHGEFERWIEGNFDFAVTSARNYMRLAATPGLEPATVAGLPLGVVYQVASPDLTAEHRAEIFAPADDGRRPAERKVRSRLAHVRRTIKEQKEREAADAKLTQRQRASRKAAASRRRGRRSIGGHSLRRSSKIGMPPQLVSSPCCARASLKTSCRSLSGFCGSSTRPTLLIGSGADVKALASSISAKVAAMIPRLASGHDGERLATVAAIQRTLGGAGNDLHDLAAVVASEPAVSRRVDRDERRDGNSQSAIFWEELSGFERRRWLDRLHYDHALSDWEAGFVDSIRRQMLDRGERMRFSAKQTDSLNRILWKALDAGVHP